jgi:hypothetical protein
MILKTKVESSVSKKEKKIQIQGYNMLLLSHIIGQGFD